PVCPSRPGGDPVAALLVAAPPLAVSRDGLGNRVAPGHQTPEIGHPPVLGPAERTRKRAPVARIADNDVLITFGARGRPQRGATRAGVRKRTNQPPLRCSKPDCCLLDSD